MGFVSFFLYDNRGMGVISLFITGMGQDRKKKSTRAGGIGIICAFLSIEKNVFLICHLYFHLLFFLRKRDGTGVILIGLAWDRIIFVGVEWNIQRGT